MTPKFIGCRLAQWLGRGISPGAVMCLAEAAEDLWWRVARQDREGVAKNLSLVLGRPVEEHSPLVREVFRNFGRYLVEFLTIDRVTDPRMRVEGREYLEAATRHGRGAILLTGHLGNWEMAAISIRRLGFPISAIVQPHDDPRVDQLFTRQRERCGVHVIPLGARAAQAGLACLGAGRLLGMLGDWAADGHGVSVAFCGTRVRLHEGPAVLSVRGRVPVVPAFLVRDAPWQFRLSLEPPIWPDQAPPCDERGVRARKARVQWLIGAYAAQFEQYLKRSPTQWIMFRPLAEPAGRPQPSPER